MLSKILKVIFSINQKVMLNLCMLKFTWAGNTFDFMCTIPSKKISYMLALACTTVCVSIVCFHIRRRQKVEI
jgi:hypothetical protein